MGDAMGDLVVAPAILVWATRSRFQWKASRIGEGAAMVAILGTVTYMVFATPSTHQYQSQALVYAPFPFLIWAAFRFGPRGTATCTFFISIVAVIGSTRGVGPFVANTQETAFRLTLAYLLVLSLTSMVLAAVIAERGDARKRLNDALTKVLGGFIPICANCKRIREETDTWVAVEHYVRSRTDAEFSHTICPTCRKELYPDLEEWSPRGGTTH